MIDEELLDRIEPPSDDAPHLLVVDDDTRIRMLLHRFLRENGFRVTIAGDAAEARRKLRGLEFDLIILDIMMPGEDGVELTRSLRQERNVPILMLTALSETENRVTGLEAGADDYLPKPFDPRELVLRINNILRRGGQQSVPAVEQVVFGPYTFQIPRRELKRNGQVMRLTEREREILAIFAERAGETISRMELVGSDSEVGERTIDVQINRLRRKIERDPSNPVWLQTVRGIGYKLCVE
jgi:Response regulators consisting of a CheY-like receiver domain and a winged-helix DNA-binding domain